VQAADGDPRMHEHIIANLRVWNTGQVDAFREMSEADCAGSLGHVITGINCDYFGWNA
jgi:hypothetical protein